MAVDMFLNIDGIPGESTDASQERNRYSIVSRSPQLQVQAGQALSPQESNDAGLSFCYARQQGVAKTISVLCKWSPH